MGLSGADSVGVFRNQLEVVAKTFVRSILSNGEWD
jgi:hypothetical protein